MAQEGLSQKVLAEKLGWDKSKINNYVNGTMPPVKNLRLLAKKFNVTIDDLLERDLQKEGPSKNKSDDKNNIINRALMNEVKRLYEIIDKQGGDDIAADNALDKGIKELRSNIGKE